jgi:hypothetical protein
MSRERRAELKNALQKQFRSIRAVRGYLVYMHGSSTNEGVFCQNLDRVESEIKRYEKELS